VRFAYPGYNIESKMGSSFRWNDGGRRRDSLGPAFAGTTRPQPFYRAREKGNARLRPLLPRAPL